jgi:hypothetical protein
MDSRPLRFILEPIEVTFRTPPALSKRPGCPDGFTWREQTFQITEMLAEWHDFSRRGRMGRNMRPAHADRAGQHGSLGVGQFYFQVRVQDGRVFVIYYDRAPKQAGDRAGTWYLEKEMML